MQGGAFDYLPESLDFGNLIACLSDGHLREQRSEVIPLRGILWTGKELRWTF